jgi:hypothetical protein
MTNTKKLVKIDKSVKFEAVTGSSIIAGYARAAGDLAVKFNNGSKYIYKGVDDATVAAFKLAESKGKYFSANIKPKFEAQQAE